MTIALQCHRDMKTPSPSRVKEVSSITHALTTQQEGTSHTSRAIPAEVCFLLLLWNAVVCEGQDQGS